MLSISICRVMFDNKENIHTKKLFHVKYDFHAIRSETILLPSHEQEKIFLLENYNEKYPSIKNLSL